MSCLSKPFECRRFCWVLAPVLAFALSACGPSADVTKLQQKADVIKRDLDAMTKERDSLKSQVAELSDTPWLLLGKVSEPTSAGKLIDAQQALQILKAKFPQTKEAQEAQALVEALRIKLEKQQLEAHRLEALGFSALKSSQVIDSGGVKLNVGVPSFSKQFSFDRYGSSYHFRDADRDHKYLVIGLSATAAKGVTDPELPGFALYWADGKRLHRIDKFDLHFVRWEDFATYLGNYSDSRNDFAKTSTILFTMASHGADEKMAKRPLYVVGTTKGCQKRQYERFKNPPVYYLSGCTELEETLNLDSFSTGKLLVIKRID